MLGIVTNLPLSSPSLSSNDHEIVDYSLTHGDESCHCLLINGFRILSSPVNPGLGTPPTVSFVGQSI